MTTTATETPTERSFTEAEMLSIAADRVQRDTAELRESAEAAQARVTELENQLDVKTGELTTVTAEKAAAETELAEFKAQIEGEREAAGRKDARVTALREAAAHLGDGFFSDETRIQRICAMDDETFDTYKADMAATSGSASATPSRETAMEGTPAVPATKSGGAPGVLAPAARALLGRGTVQEG